MASSLRLLSVALGVALVAGHLRGGDMVPSSLEAEPVSMVEVAATTGTQSGAGRSLGIRGDLTVQGVASMDTLASLIGDIQVSGGLTVQNTMEAGSARAAHMSVEETTSISDAITSKEDQLLVLGQIDADSVSGGSFSTSFLEIQGVAQWSLVSIEDFEEEEDVLGWSQKDLTECSGQKFLGGPCTKAGDTEVSKTFTALPPHTQLRISAKFLFIDSWDGESAYMTADGKHVWADTYNHKEVEAKSGINMCGNGTPEGRFMRNIDVVVPHTGPTFELKFGATTDEHSCDESFGVDSVMLMVR